MQRERETLDQPARDGFLGTGEERLHGIDVCVEQGLFTFRSGLEAAEKQVEVQRAGAPKSARSFEYQVTGPAWQVLGGLEWRFGRRPGHRRGHHPMTMTRAKLTRAAAETEGRVVPAMLELRDVDAGRRYLEGRAVPYGVPADIGWYVETFDRGVFAKSIREAANGLPLLLFHNGSSLDTLIGRAESWSEQTDGLHGVLDADSLKAILKGAPDVEVAARTLVEAAMERGSRDNVTALVVRYEGAS